jgi:hypothetical protein
MKRALLLVMLVLLLGQITAQPSDAIQITGSVTNTEFAGFALFVALTGQSGFSLGAIAASSIFPHCQLHGSIFLDDRCPPGVVIPLDDTWVTQDVGPFFSQATLGGKSYSVASTGEAGTASAIGHFVTARVTTPEFAVGELFTLQESFAFVGSFTYFDQPGEPKVEPLFGRGTLTLTLFQSPAAEGSLWEAGFSYQFDPVAPTPEPATLLLLGATAAGAGFVRWRRRQEREGNSTVN